MDNGDNQNNPRDPIEGLFKFFIQRKCICRKPPLFSSAAENYYRQKMERWNTIYEGLMELMTGIECKRNDVAALEEERNKWVKYINAIDIVIEVDTNQSRAMR